MKYFFLADGWVTGRVWEFGGLWNEVAKRRKPYLQKQSLCIHENGERLWLYHAEDSILMVEVKPQGMDDSHHAIGQVVLKRLLSADQVIEKLCEEKTVAQINAQLAVPSNQPEKTTASHAVCSPAANNIASESSVVNNFREEAVIH